MSDGGRAQACPNNGEVPERLNGEHWKCDGRSNAAREFEPRPLFQQRLFSSVGIRSGEVRVFCSPTLLRRGFIRAPSPMALP